MMEQGYGYGVPRLATPMMMPYGISGPGMAGGMPEISYNTAADAAMLAESLESMMTITGTPMGPMLAGVPPGATAYFAPNAFAGPAAASAAAAAAATAAAYGYPMLQPQPQMLQQENGRPGGSGGDRGGRGGRSRGGGGGGAAGAGPGERRGGGGGGGAPASGGAGAGAGSGTGGRKKRTQRGLEDNVRRTVYISYIDQQVTEESLATFFADCGTVMDCRICGDPNSAMRFAFIEFAEDVAAQKALSKTGAVLGSSPLRVLPSKTAIVPVNRDLMPRTSDELERCGRTVYVANIDKKVDKEDVRGFFEQLCGKVNKIRLLGDFAHSTRIAFVEFNAAEGAMAALNCSGALLGALPLRVSPSKTPVRGDSSDDGGGGGGSGGGR